MARREWAEQIIAKHERKDDWGIEYVSSTEVQRLLLKEHARAVRVVEQVVKHAAHMEQQTRVNREANAYWQGKLDGAENILAALTKGRA